MARQDALARQIKVVQWTDRDIRRIARLAAAEADRIVRTSSDLRGAQVRLAADQVEMWAGVRSATVDGMHSAAAEATKYQALYDTSLAREAGVTLESWTQRMMATADQGVQSLISRRENGMSLSQRVWRNSRVATRGINDAINVGLALGKSPAEIAQDVRKYISPNYPGGASSAAMRLGRTEVLNAYHQTALRRYAQTPWVEKVKWNLSGSHPRPDQCNEYATSGNLAGAGIWTPEAVPDKPHPNCLCYVEPVPMDLETYAQRYEAGDFDDYIDAQLASAVA